MLFGGRRADKPLKGPASPSSKVYQLLPGYTSRTTTNTTTTTTTNVTTHIGEHFHPTTLFVFKPLRTRPRAFCTSRLHVPLHADKRPFYIPAPRVGKGGRNNCVTRGQLSTCILKRLDTAISPENNHRFLVFSFRTFPCE